jgi:hypothetical protein
MDLTQQSKVSLFFQLETAVPFNTVHSDWFGKAVRLW